MYFRQRSVYYVEEAAQNNRVEPEFITSGWLTRSLMKKLIIIFFTLYFSDTFTSPVTSTSFSPSLSYFSVYYLETEAFPCCVHRFDNLSDRILRRPNAWMISLNSSLMNPVSVFWSHKLKFHWDQFSRNFLVTSLTSPRTCWRRRQQVRGEVND